MSTVQNILSLFELNRAKTVTCLWLDSYHGGHGGWRVCHHGLHGWPRLVVKFVEEKFL
jgi:hypothetical protein